MSKKDIDALVEVLKDAFGALLILLSFFIVAQLTDRMDTDTAILCLVAFIFMRVTRL